MARQRPTRILMPHLVMGPCIVEIDRIVIREVQYQLEVNRCRNEEVIAKGNFGWAWPMWAGHPRVGNVAMHMNRCRNEEIIVKGNFGWVWPMWPGYPRIDHIVIREVQYQLEVNGCRNEEIIIKGNFGWVWPMWAGRPRIDRIVIRNVQYQFEVNWCRNEEDNFQCSKSGQDGLTAEITTISLRFSKSVGIIKVKKNMTVSKNAK
ncbi:hypothetical protein DPMN_011559 [Dreissena polymorpha]|uniref:Uncharacterized protein n=1 Tax=Dreissena polymorpha TaxID=45954 RepID=A0A9D4N0S9_DREPO|nr:hypothetical protein DPMN_011559 [Dreissena polymorpha]